MGKVRKSGVLIVPEGYRVLIVPEGYCVKFLPNT
jgi:5-deoxy-D-glucuronate isomerase